jgi:hypothetical protein
LLMTPSRRSGFGPIRFQEKPMTLCLADITGAMVILIG